MVPIRIVSCWLAVLLLLLQSSSWDATTSGGGGGGAVVVVVVDAWGSCGGRRIRPATSPAGRQRRQRIPSGTGPSQPSSTPPPGRRTSAFFSANTETEAPATKEGGGGVCPVRTDVREMPPPLSAAELKNRYYLLRHGQSTANVASIISSSRSLAYTPKHGLTSVGQEQGVSSAAQLVEALENVVGSQGNKKNVDDDDNGDGSRVIFVSSPFARAVQTAEACLEGLRQDDGKLISRIRDNLGLQVSPDVVFEDRLVERYFGRLDGEAIYTYAYVWPLDKFDVAHRAFDVESVAAVATRIRSVVLDLEQRYSNCHIVLVGHADVLQIAQLYGAFSEDNNLNVGEFSSYRFANGEVRPMLIGTAEHLPDPVPLEAPERGTADFQRTLSMLDRLDLRALRASQSANADTGGGEGDDDTERPVFAVTEQNLINLFDDIDADGTGSIRETDLYDALRTKCGFDDVQGIRRLLRGSSSSSDDGDQKGFLSRVEWRDLVAGTKEQ